LFGVSASPERLASRSRQRRESLLLRRRPISPCLTYCVLWKMFAATLASSSGVSFCSDAHLAVLNHDHDLMHKATVAAREFENFTGLHFPAFSVFPLGVSAHGSLSIGSHTIMP
jgi:hypothetical protein